MLNKIQALRNLQNNNWPGTRWSFISLFILVQTLLLIRNGDMGTNLKIFLIQPNWIAGNGQELQSRPVQKGSSSRQNIMMDFVCGRVNTQNIRSVKVNGKKGKVMY